MHAWVNNVCQKCAARFVVKGNSTEFTYPSWSLTRLHCMPHGTDMTPDTTWMKHIFFTEQAHPWWE